MAPMIVSEAMVAWLAKESGEEGIPMDSSALIEREFLFGEDRPFGECHAATVIELPEGDTLVAYFGGTRESHPDVSIWLSRRRRGQWEHPIEVADEPDVPHWNPVLFQAPDGTVLLFYKVGTSPTTWTTRVTRSNDFGTHWTAPEQLPSMNEYPRGPVKDKLIVLQNGSWLAPTSRETNNKWDAAADISNDKGDSWNLSASVPLDRSRTTGEGIIQPTIWESQPGKVHMLLRSSEGSVYRSDSEDGGSTWSEAYPTQLPNNNSGIDLAAHDSGLLALCYNPVGQNWGKRTPLVIGVSRDGGQSWRNALTLEDEDAYPQRNGRNEFSYPAIVSTAAGFSVVYTWKRERIAYWRIPLDRLR